MNTEKLSNANGYRYVTLDQVVMWGTTNNCKARFPILGTEVKDAMLRPLDGGAPVMLRDLSVGGLRTSGEAMWVVLVRIDHTS